MDKHPSQSNLDLPSAAATTPSKPTNIENPTNSDRPDHSVVRAEIIAIGDELSSGVRLDTNSQWISQHLDQLGIQTAFHSTVGDDLEDMLSAFETAAGRVDLIFTTGGLGPTADDLTRNVIAQLGRVDLELNQSVLEHIKSMYQSRGREMPPNNQVQAWFPAGASVIDNPEGTAPGIEFSGTTTGAHKPTHYHMFSLPGVPVELKQMWHGSIRQRLAELYSIDTTIFHHTIHCFGSGESAIEMQLPDLIQRGRDPLVGITASSATISLRIATRGTNQQACLTKMQPTIDIIHQRLGDLVFGENGQTLEQAVAQKLATQQQTISVFDWGLGGDVARRLIASEPTGCLCASRSYAKQPVADGLDGDFVIADRMQQILHDQSWHEGADVVLAIGPIDRNEQTIANGESYFDVMLGWQEQGQWQTQSQQLRYSGHSAWRELRAVKDVLNFVRLHAT